MTGAYLLACALYLPVVLGLYLTGGLPALLLGLAAALGYLWSLSAAVGLCGSVLVWCLARKSWGVAALAFVLGAVCIALL